MDTMKKPALIAWLVSAFAGSLLADAPQIVLDGVRQRYPWNNDVDIDYTVSGVEEPANVFVRFRLKENAEAEPVTLTEFGDISTLAEASNGTYRVVWRADRERSGHFFSTNAVMTAELVYSPNMEGMPYNVFKDYIVVDLSGGVSAETFPVSHVTMTVDAATNTFNTAEYKTNKLVLRRVGACTFPMGEETQPYYDTTLAPETPHEVTLTKDFFIGIYEVTQKQYELVTGVAASYGDRPVVNVSCYNMRGDAGGVLEKP
ncbi:MAG: hypothetical protein ILO34_03320, partial [Kiritimatiellae bacterium]|nr:hypothetical protein [Kiritimatiellia bacterium]